MADQPTEPATAFLDAKGMRVLAHPARVQLVYLLRKHGASTATRLAELMGVNSGTASYHLRQLAAAGFVDEDTERGNGRERWWRAAHQQTVLDDKRLVATDGDAAVAYLRSIAATHEMHTQRTLSEFQTMPSTWRDDVFTMSQFPLRLTPQEAARLRTELTDLLARYRRDEPGTAPDGAERVTAMIYLLPDLETEDEP